MVKIVERWYSLHSELLRLFRKCYKRIIFKGCIFQTKCLLVSYRPLFLSQTVIEYCALCRVEHPHIFCVLLARDLTAIFVFGKQGNEDQQSGLWEIPVILHMISLLWSWPKEEVYSSIERQLMNWNEKLKRHFSLCFSWLLKWKSVSYVLCCMVVCRLEVGVRIEAK